MQEAREEIEKAGVVVFKDASANKGGVTSSSLEVLAALTLTDDEFRTHMAVSKEACAHGRPAEKDVRSVLQCLLTSSGSGVGTTGA
jgi:glutamate dehydrogenase